MRKRRVVVVGEERFNFEQLRRLPTAADVTFEGLFRFDQVQDQGAYPLPELHAAAVSHFDERPARPDGVMGYWDFPVTSLVALLCERYRLRGASIESVLKCEHKYWSRLEQRRAVPELTPAFEVFDPFDDAAVANLDLRRPLWIKPVKSHSSQLGFHVHDFASLRLAIEKIRGGIDRFAEPFRFVLDRARLPDQVAGVGGRHCLAEQIIDGAQCTAEGVVHDGQPSVYAIIDSVRHANSSSFARYQYPSRLPRGVQQRIARACERIMGAIGYDDATFNIEFFWDGPRDQLWLLEINPRLSQSHADITEKVDGVSNLAKMVDACLGRRPDLVRRQGSHRCAAKCFVRSFHDATVRSVPTPRQIERIERDNPGARVQLVARPGQQLSRLQNQDSYSYELAVVHVGAKDERELDATFERVRRALRFDLEAPRTLRPESPNRVSGPAPWS